jgi:hypothetical protein
MKNMRSMKEGMKGVGRRGRARSPAARGPEQNSTPAWPPRSPALNAFLHAFFMFLMFFMFFM